MSHTTSAAIRQHFLDYFARSGHAVVKSSSLIPVSDPTLMFTNAGMVQFKDVFVGAEKRPYTRAASSQKCMRVSGKHNDLEEVGRTARHHTFFEMLGNFSFGDYFKEEAIVLAWKFITDEVGLDPQRLWITVFGGEGELAADDEARSLWRKISGLPEHRILGMGMADNFWAMGELGPCGPCTEIHYDQGGEGEPTLDDFESGRVIEIWNNVFMQFDRQQKNGELVLLPKPSVDTGMGLERLTAILQGQTSNYHTDLFVPVIETIAEAAGKRYRRSDDEDDVSMRVIADHARATAFLVADGLQPGNQERSYVMRRIMRRAIRHGRKLGFDDLFLDRACEAVVETMGAAYPELLEARTLIVKVAENEEKAFRRTLDVGLKVLSRFIDRARARGSDTLGGADAFKLKDTYGFPPDLTEIIAGEHGLAFDHEGFARELSKPRGAGGDTPGGEAVAEIHKALAGRLGELKFVGYTHEEEPLEQHEGHWRRRGRYLEVETTVRALLQQGAEVQAVEDGEVEVILDPTPFYGEAGGQVGDRGVIVGDSDLSLEVLDSQKPVEGLTVSRCRILDGRVSVGQSVWAGYDPQVRKQTRAHHSATHLLHASLRQVLGDHVKQQGSLVDPDHLRFDYAHFEPLTLDQLRAVEEEVNIRVAKSDPVVTEVLPFDEARQKGAIALFGEKYGDVVRVVAMGKSVEFCGGTHVRSTSDIGIVLITNEELVASGIRRIEAEVSDAALLRARRTASMLARAVAILQSPNEPQADTDQSILMALVKATRTYNQLIQDLASEGVAAVELPEQEVSAPRLSNEPTVDEARAVRDLWQGVVAMANARASETDTICERFAAMDPSHLLERYATLLKANRDNERKLAQVRRAKLTRAAGDMLAATREVGGVKVLATRVDDVDGKGLRELADKLRDKLQSGIVCVGGRSAGKATLLVAVTRDLSGRFHAGSLVKELAPLVGGRGGGKAELAQAGGSNPEAIDQVFERLVSLVGSA